MGRAKHSGIPLTFDDIDPMRTLISAVVTDDAITVQYAPDTPEMVDRSVQAISYLKYQSGGPIPPGSYTFWANNWYGAYAGKFN